MSIRLSRRSWTSGLSATQSALAGCKIARASGRSSQRSVILPVAGSNPFMRFWNYTRDLFFGGSESLPDAVFLVLIQGSCVALQDTAGVVFYTAIQAAVIAADPAVAHADDCATQLWALWGTYFAIFNIVSFPLGFLTGWLCDWWERHTHIALAGAALGLLLVQSSTMVVTSKIGLGILFNLHLSFMTQLQVDRLKIVKSRCERFYGMSEFLLHDKESNRIAPLGDFFGSAISAVGYFVIWQTNRWGIFWLDRHIGRWVIYCMSGSFAFVVIGCCLRYKTTDLIDPELDEVTTAVNSEKPGEGNLAEGIPDEYTGLQGNKSKKSPFQKFLKYLVHSFKALWKNQIAKWTLVLILLVNTVNLMVVYPLSQDQASEFPAPASWKYKECNNALPNVYLQNVTAQIGYVLGASFYVMVYAHMPPYDFNIFGYPVAAFVCAALAVPFFYTWQLDVYASSVLLAALTVVTYFMNGRYEILGMAAVDDEYFGFYNSLYSVGVTICTEVPALTSALSATTNTQLVIALTMLAASCIVSVSFAVFYKDSLRAHNDQVIPGVEEGPKLDLRRKLRNEYDEDEPTEVVEQ